MKRKLLVGIIAITTALAITGCQGNKENKETDKNATLTYGTATLTYGEFYSGDVSSVEGYDAVASATKAKHSIMSNMNTDFVDESTNASGYHILGVKNVAVAVNVKDLDTYKKINPSFVETGDQAPAQYKVVSIENEKVTYSKTVTNVKDTIKDATAELLTGSNWGDYQINITDGEKKYLRNTKEDTGFAINSESQGVILETKSGIKVGMEHLQSIWVQPYEVSFNVVTDNSHNTHITAFDNLKELSKLEGETVTKITFVMPSESYVYEFEGIYIKPVYAEKISATLNGADLKLSTSDFSKLTNATIEATYTVGKGKEAKKYSLLNEKVTGTDYKLNLTEIEKLEDKSGTYSVVIKSDNFANITVSVPSNDKHDANATGEKKQ